MKKFEISIILAIGIMISFVGVNIIHNSETFENRISILENRPNIIVILTDDVSVDMINFLLENRLMPNLQKYFLDEGITFQNSFVSSPLCCPSRVTTLTGLYPHNHEILFNKPVFINDTQIVKGGFKDFDDSSTVAIWLDDSGYTTGFLDKYMNGYVGKITYIPPGWDDWKAFASNTEVMYNFGVNDNGKIIRIKDEYKTDYLANAAVDFIQNSESPFFLYISTLVAHSTRDAPECEIYDGVNKKTVLVSPKYQDSLKNFQIIKKPSFNEKDVSDKNPFYREIPIIKNIDCLESQFKDRTTSLRSVDDLIGSIYNALLVHDLQENTVIIFTSDNGYSFGEHRIHDKVHPYEESIRVPLYIRVPGIENQSVNHLVINNDIAPTILDLVDIENEIITDGLSLLPIMNNSSKNLRNDFLIELYAGNGVFYEGIRNSDSLYVEWRGIFNFTEYYNLNDDPFQQSNLAECNDEQCIEKMKKLALRLDELKKCGFGSCSD